MSVYTVSYSEKCIAVFGQTTPIKDHLASIGGKFNPGLTNPQTKSREAGWIFSKTKQADVQTLVDKAVQGQLQPLEIKPVEKAVKTKSEIPDFIFTKEMYLALVSRIERLENENANMLDILRSNKIDTDSINVSIQPVKRTAKKQVQKEESEEESEEERQSIPKKSFLF
jgi:hypothetical protein